MVDPDGRGLRIFFQQVENPKVSKNRVHLDLNVGSGPGTPPHEQRSRIEAEAARLVALGATRIREGEQFGHAWLVLQDPEGNEFCVQ